MNPSLARKVEAAVSAIPKRARDHGILQGNVWPLATKGNRKHGQRMSPTSAWHRRRLELNPENSTQALILDVDHGDIEVIPWDVQDGDDPMRVKRTWRVRGRFARLPKPTWIVQDDTTGKCHVVYVLRDPVQHNRSSRRKPQRLMRSVQQRLRRAWRADSDYNHRLTRNPCRPGPGVTTYWMRSEPYNLGELSNAVTDTTPSRRPSSTVEEKDSRNCQTFEAVNRAAFGYHNAKRILAGELDTRDLVDDVHEEIAESLGQPTMSASELACIARSVRRRLDRYWSEADFSARQSACGRLSAEKRSGQRQERNRYIYLMAKHHSARQIVSAVRDHPNYSELAVGVRQVYRIIRQEAETARANPTDQPTDSTVAPQGAGGGSTEAFTHNNQSRSATLTVKVPVTTQAQNDGKPGKADSRSGLTDAPTGREPPGDTPNGDNLPEIVDNSAPMPMSRSPGVPLEDAQVNEMRNRAMDVQTLARKHIARMEAEGDFAGADNIRAIYKIPKEGVHGDQEARKDR